jgi:hypothetical protein
MLYALKSSRYRRIDESGYNEDILFFSQANLQDLFIFCSNAE